MATSLRRALVSLLEGDATLVTTLTGGIYDRRELNRTATSAAYDSRGNLEPCAVVVIESTAALGPAEFDFERAFVQVYLYEQEGNHYAGIDVAKERVRALLHRQQVTITPGAVFEMRHTDSLGDSYDEALGAEMTYERFLVWKKRAA